ncbi:hypothetical protein QWZ04_22775 [Vibrio tapetis subsp. quintayensis]|uniref:hypothetical protein n=1 Tax=Vibrio tapetis TaxID=52443 RepID=UPI0025B5DCB8|nr:hypothetical protein [Vibrio tapetis]MDN3683136.1 hypothetical protein [Vibrio tapetis subsp. quintayensis]
MQSFIKKAFIVAMLLWGALLMSALAQVAQYVLSTNSARAHTYTVYLEHQSWSHQRRIDALRELKRCELGQPISEDATHPIIKPVNLYECLNKKGFNELSAAIKRSDEAMMPVSWPLSLFW